MAIIPDTAAAIRAFDYREGYEEIRGEILAAIEGVLASGSLILGPRVRAFEENFARFLGATGSAVGVGNGTDALAIALRALGIGPGDEVITVSNTAIPTVSAIRMVGASVVFADIDPHTLLMDIDNATARITKRTRAIVPVHLYGNAVDMDRLMQLAARYSLSVVEDCAQACGTTWNGQMTGTFGDVGCFSFYPTKNLGAYGDGGLCFTRRTDLAETIRQIRAYGCGETYCALREGVNSRFDELQAAILDVKLRHLSRYLAKRRAIAREYEEHLAPSIARPRIAPQADHSYHLFVVVTDDREHLVAKLTREGIGFGIHYPTPIHRMSGYEFLGYGEGSLPITERAARRVLSLPCYPELQLESVRTICQAVNAATGSKIEIRRLLVFSMVGALNTAVCYALYAALVHWSQWHHNRALVADYVLGMFLGFAMHRLATFGDRKQIKLAFGKYLAALAMTFVLNLAVLDLLVAAQLLGPLAGQAVAVALVTLVSFMLQKHWVFRSYQQATDAPEVAA